MVRTVKVQLEADTGRYIPPVERAKEATESLDRKVEALDRDLNKIPADAAKAAAAMKLLGDESGKASVRMDDLNKRTSLGTLEQKLIHTRGEVRALAEEFNRTGDSNVLAKLFGKQGDLQELEKLKSKLTNALRTGAEEGGQQGGRSFLSALQGYLSTPMIGPIVGGALAAAVVAALPAVGGALMGAAGLGGIALGVVGQLGDQKVTQAFIDLRHRLGKELTAATSDFKEPLIATAGIFGDALSRSLHSIDFGSLSKAVVPIASGLGGLLTNMMPGFNHMLEQAVPLLRALSTDLEHVGTGLSLMFDLFARGGKGAQESLRGLVYVLIGVAAAIGGIVLVASKLVEWFSAAGSAVGGLVEKFGRMVPFGSFIESLGRGVKQFFDSFNGANDVEVVARNLHTMGLEASYSQEQLALLSGQLNQTQISADTLAASMVEKVFNALMSVDQAVLSVNQSLTQLSDSFKQNGKSIDEHTAKGQANVQAIYGAVTANMQLYQAQVASGMSAADAAGQYDANTAALERQLRKAGLTQQQIDGLIGKYKAIPPAVNTDIAARGLSEAINNLGNLIARLNGLNGRDFGFTITSKTVYESDYITHRQGERGNRWGGIYEHAAEGLLSAKMYAPANPGRYMIAEPQTGGEAFVPRFGDYRRSTSILDQASRWYGGRFVAGGMGGGGSMVTVPITINAGMGADGYALGRQIAEVLRPYVNSKGGNVQVALGR